MRIYIDTSVINGLYVKDTVWIKEMTKDFFKRARNRYKLFISDIVADEIKETPDAGLRRKLMETVEEFDIEILPVSEEVKQLAEDYVKNKIIPVKYIADALHIAFATMHNIPVLVSWNFEHIVKHKTRIEVRRVNKEKNLPFIDICSPEEV